MMHAFLAQASAEHADSAARLLVGLLVLVGFPALAIVCIVKAFTRRTTAWIVAGSILGLILALLITGFVIGIVKALEKRHEADESSASSTLDADEAGSAAKPLATEVIQGRDIGYSLRVPVTWTTQRKKDAFDILCSFKSVYVGVIAEEAELGGPDVIANIARKTISKTGTDVHWTEPKALSLDGRNWLEFSVDCKVEGIPFSYVFFVYGGHEGTFQIVGWTTQNLFERDGPTMREVMQTFRFPE